MDHWQGGLAVCDCGQPGESVEMIAPARLLHVLLRYPVGHAGKQGQHILGIHLCIPEREIIHRRELGEPSTIRGNGATDTLVTNSGAKPIDAARHYETGRQPFDIPFPVTPKRLIKVIEVEDELTFRRRKQPEIVEMRVATGLYEQGCGRRASQIAGHHRRRATQEGKRGLQHAPIADGQQVSLA